jgi:pimeloyl-ACP methyl ester carboxylesterase
MTSHVVVGSDRRVLAYQEFGPSDGTPLLLFHGAPGSRLFCPDVAVTDAASVRCITFDRPGYGESTPRPARRVLDVVADVEVLLDHLAVDRLPIVGWSGGGPFAVATAYALGDRVSHLSVVSAPGPLDEVPGAWDALGEYRRPTAEMARREPERSARAIGRHMAPYVEEPTLFLGRGDPAIQGAVWPMLVAQVSEALRQGIEGVASDLVAMWCEWGFELADVTTPAHIWHGARDPHNADDAECYARSCAHATLTVWPEAGHMGIVTYWADVLAAALAGCSSN